MRLWQRSKTERAVVEPDILYQNYVLPPMSTTDAPVDCVLTKFVRSAMNKVKCPIYSLCWTPEGKRLITGASSGEFTLWNGTAFNFETILQAIIFTYLSFKFIFLGPWCGNPGDEMVTQRPMACFGRSRWIRQILATKFQQCSHVPSTQGRANTVNKVRLAGRDTGPEDGCFVQINFNYSNWSHSFILFYK